MKQALSSYQKMEISGMNQRDLIVMLYNGAIKFLNQARNLLKEQAGDPFSDAIERAHRIIYHLYTTLDFEQGGEVAENLGALYTYIIGQMYVVNSTKDIKIIDDLLVILENLKDGWQNLDLENIEQSSPRVDVMPSGKQTVVSTKV